MPPSRPDDSAPLRRPDDPSEMVWVGLSTEPLSVSLADEWVVSPDCGAVVTFTGRVRDHAQGRSGVTGLSYEAYREAALPRLRAVADQARQRWPQVGRVVIWHRTGDLALTEAAVVVSVAAGHREQAFEAARFCIDTVKAAVPIWKHERWADGADWGTDAQPLADLELDVPSSGQVAAR